MMNCDVMKEKKSEQQQKFSKIVFKKPIEA